MFTVFWEAYIFFSTRALIHTEAILTELVFEHSLRVRFTAEPMNDERSDSQHVRDNSVTMVDESEADASSGSGAESDSTATMTATANAIVQKGKNKIPSPTTAPSEPNVSTSSPAKKPLKNTNLVGKINNFMTTDLNNIMRAKDFFFLRTFCVR